VLSGRIHIGWLRISEHRSPEEMRLAALRFLVRRMLLSAFCIKKSNMHFWNFMTIPLPNTNNAKYAYAHIMIL
jgi:hypothetical protein